MQHPLRLTNSKIVTKAGAHFTLDIIIIIIKSGILCLYTTPRRALYQTLQVAIEVVPDIH